MCDLEMFWAKCSEKQALLQTQKITVTVIKMKSWAMICTTGKKDLFTELSRRNRGGYAWAFLTGKRLVDISFYCLREAHSLRLRQSQSSYDTNAWEEEEGRHVTHLNKGHIFSHRNIEYKNWSGSENTSVKRSSLAQGRWKMISPDACPAGSWLALINGN